MNKISKLFLITNGVILIFLFLLFFKDLTSFIRISTGNSSIPKKLIEVIITYEGLMLLLGSYSFWSALNTNRYKMALSTFTIIYFSAGVIEFTGMFYGCNQSNLIVIFAKLLSAFFALYINKIIPFIQKEREKYRLLFLLMEVNHQLKLKKKSLENQNTGFEYL